MLVSKFINEIESQLYKSVGSDRVQTLLEAEAVDEITASTSLVSTTLSKEED